MWTDIRLALRALAKSPSFAATTILALALGIGANTAIFSVINGLLLHPAGIPDPDRLLAIRVKYDKLNLKSITVSATDFADIRDSKQVFSSAAMLSEADFNYTALDLPERLPGAQVSWQWFDVFGVKPLLGRVFRPEEDQPNANQVAVLSYAAWKRWFGGDAAIVGRTIQLNQQLYKVVGVMGPDFDWPARAQVWVPIGLPPGAYGADNRFNESYFAVAKIQPGVTVAQAQAFVHLLTGQIIERDPQGAYAQASQWGMFALPLTDFVYGDLRTPLFVLIGAVGFVLLIACSNIAGLMLARASGRARELAVRSALGARRWHLIRQTLAESLVLAAAGTLVGLGVAQAGVRILLWLAPAEVAMGLVIRLDAYVLAFTAVVGALAGILSGVAPAWQVSGAHDFELLKEGGRWGTASRGRLRLRALLVAGQVALALVLLVGAGLFLKSLARLARVNPGFDPQGVMTAALSLPESQYKEEQKQVAFYRAVSERLASLPGVSSAAAVVPLPFSGSNFASSFNIEGRPQGPGDPGPHSDLRAVTPGYFSALKIKLLAGRTFTEQDREGTQFVTVIDENLARQYWPDQEPLGKRLRRGSNAPWVEIVGIVAHVHHSELAGDTGKGVCYYPMYQIPISRAFLIARTNADPAGLAGPIREAVRSVAPGQPVYDLSTMENRLGTSLAARRFAVTVLGFFAGVALLMSALGLYGVISYTVTQRTQEIGIRIALGAQVNEVLGLVVTHGLRLVSAGILLGLAAALSLSRLLATQLFQVSPFDPLTFAVTAIVLLIAAILASYVPARRATKIDPIVALRYE